MKYLISFIVGALTLGSISYAIAAPTYTAQRTLVPIVPSDIGTTTPNSASGPWRNLYIDQICLTSDSCRTSWPSGAGGSFPFSADTNYNQVVYSTSTPTLWFKSGLFASSTSIFANASTTQIGSTENAYFATSNGSVGIGTTTPDTKLTIAGALHFYNSSQAGYLGNVSSLPIAITGGPGASDFYLTGGTSNDFFIASQGNTTGEGLHFGNASASGATFTEYMTLLGAGTGAGFLGIGTTSPASKLQIGSISATPVADTVTALSLGNTYSATAGTNLKLNVYESGSTKYGLGISSGSLDIVAGQSTGAINFYTNALGGTAKMIIDAGGRLGIASTSPQHALSVGTGVSAFYVSTTTGKVVGYDSTNAWAGRITPTRNLTLSTATTTAWTASTTGAYIPFAVAPFDGTIQQAQCSTDSSFLGVNIYVGASTSITPSYFVASTTVGTIAVTATNTFTKGQLINMAVGTTTTSGATKITCTLGVTETI